MIDLNDCTADLKALHFGITEADGMTLTVKMATFECDGAWRIHRP